MGTREDSEDVQARLFKAIEEGDLDEVRELLEIDPRLASAHNSDGASALIWAAYYRQAAIVELLMDRPPQPDVFEASALNLNDRLKVLLRSDRGLVDSYSFDGWTPLHLAAHFGSLDAIRTLLSNGASHRAVSHNSNGNQPLQAAAAGRQGEAVGLLLEVGADVDAPSEGGFTALHSAAASGDVGLTRRLLEAGARVDVEAQGGKTPMELAIEADHAEIVDMLEAAGPS
ncbi:MAG: ankyrin repeat domain-containing protein [Thermoplasmata archaeon]